MKQSKRSEILSAYRAGEVKRVSSTYFVVPSRFFGLGITPRMVAEVLGKEEADDARQR